MENRNEDIHSLELRCIIPELAHGRLKLWPEIGEAELDGKSYYMTRRLTLLLEILMMRMPVVVPYEHIISFVWGHKLDSTAIQRDVSVAAAQLRKIFEFSALRIEARFDFGLKLSLGED